MSLSRFDEKYIASELQKRYGEDFDSYSDEKKWDGKSYWAHVYEVHNALDDVAQWKLLELRDATTLKPTWAWVRKT